METRTAGDAIRAYITSSALRGSLIIIGLAASVVAHDHTSRVGIIHLVVSFIGLACVMFFLVALCSAPRSARDSTSEEVGFPVIWLIATMYLAAVIALGIDPTSRAGFLNGRWDPTPEAFQAYPFYGMFVVDMVIM
ncbi:hypothetical protein B0H16DRAFT_1449694 [Mycena metata]|uniref:Uncharacterized protein n=1 Tax=Mycena metata TaxID=1033252 RepID=A0AAD7K193_9AGAR|nr:hypothetical protein B0H16DRAFT_1449694 [Mycena metata]